VQESCFVCTAEQDVNEQQVRQLDLLTAYLMECPKAGRSANKELDMGCGRQRA
jgi:hypothetical protein